MGGEEGTAVGDYEHLIVERHGPVGWLINDRPDQLNAMNATMRDEFADAWLELDQEVASGSRPIEAVGTAVAAFVGPGVYVEEVSTSPRPIGNVGTSTAARLSDDPEKPEKPGKPSVPPADD